MIQGESALRWHLGSPAVMVEQLEAIADHAQRGGRLRVGIIPWTQPAPMLVVTGFHIYDRRTVLVGTSAGTTVLTSQPDLDTYLPLFDQLERLAVFGEAAAEIAARIAGEYRQLGGPP